jgi:DNA-binding response OmpR family regulator
MEIQDREIIIYNSLVIDHNTYLVKYNGNSYSLPEKEFLTLSFLVSNPDKIIERFDIMENVWKRDCHNDTIDIVIKNLQRKLGEFVLKNSPGNYSINTSKII